MVRLLIMITSFKYDSRDSQVFNIKKIFNKKFQNVSRLWMATQWHFFSTLNNNKIFVKIFTTISI